MMEFIFFKVSLNSLYYRKDILYYWVVSHEFSLVIELSRQVLISLITLLEIVNFEISPLKI